MRCLTNALQRRLAGKFAVAHVANDVFDHDHGAVNNHSEVQSAKRE